MKLRSFVAGLVLVGALLSSVGGQAAVPAAATHADVLRLKQFTNIEALRTASIQTVEQLHAELERKNQELQQANAQLEKARRDLEAGNNELKAQRAALDQDTTKLRAEHDQLASENVRLNNQISLKNILVTVFSGSTIASVLAVVGFVQSRRRTQLENEKLLVELEQMKTKLATT